MSKIYKTEDLKKLEFEALELCEEPFKNIEKIAEFNQTKMLSSFIENKVSESHINLSSSGYGYSDIGRDTLDKVYAHYFKAESALVRHSFTSGTHALTVALFGILRPGDTILSVTGEVYDTLKSVIGTENTNNSSGSLKDFFVNYDQLDLTKEGKIDFENIKNKINKKTKVVYVQKSRGYSIRPSINCEEILKVAKIVKEAKKDCYILVDNCYGEFTEKIEPTQVGADLAVGSLIKNPGGGIARSGGYIVGKKDLVNLCAQRFTSPGIGGEVGASLNLNREMFLGFFMAPLIVKEALKTSVFASALFSLMGYKVSPKHNEPRSDIVTAIILNNKENVIEFCKTIQEHSPVDSFFEPEPWSMPGYSDKVIMASGAFTGGSSIELSADAPLRPPYAVYLQGSLNFYSGKYTILKAAERLLKKG